MTLRDIVNRGFDMFCGGMCDSVSILDKDGETIKVVTLDKLDTIDDIYLDSNFISIGSSSIKPTRVRIRIDFDV